MKFRSGEAPTESIANKKENNVALGHTKSGCEQKLEGLDEHVRLQVKNEITKLNEIIAEFPKNEDDGSDGEAEENDGGAAKKKHSTKFVKAVAMAVVLTGLSSFTAKTAEARGVIADMVSIGLTGHTEEEWRAMQRARVRVYNNAVNRSERAKDVEFNEWANDVRSQRNNMRANPDNRKIEAENWKLVQEALRNLKKDPRYNGNEQGRIDAGQKILDDYHKRINGLR